MLGKKVGNTLNESLPKTSIEQPESNENKWRTEFEEI